MSKKYFAFYRIEREGEEDDYDGKYMGKKPESVNDLPDRRSLRDSNLTLLFRARISDPEAIYCRNNPADLAIRAMAEKLLNGSETFADIPRNFGPALGFLEGELLV